MPDDSLYDDLTLESLVGTSYGNVMGNLGQPTSIHDLSDGQGFYFLYHRLGSFGAVVFLLTKEVVKGKDNWPFCYVLEFDKDGFMLDYETNVGMPYYECVSSLPLSISVSHEYLEKSYLPMVCHRQWRLQMPSLKPR
jgi:hypothetical protein